MTAHTSSMPRSVGRFVSGAALITVVALAWWQTVEDARRMPDMLDGLAQAGRAMPFDGSPASFAAMWTVMMAAMMLPGIIPAAVRDEGRFVNGAAVASGYLVVWIATGVVAFAALMALNYLGAPSGWLDRAGAVLVVLAGGYQFTGWKRRALQRYHIARGGGVFGIEGAFGMGLSHGMRCLGASWALMAVLLVVGVMNVAWMALIGAICLGEKVSTSRAFGTAVGVALVAVGVVILVDPRVMGVVAGIG